MRIAQKIMLPLFPGFTLSYCEYMFPNHNSNFFIVERLGVKIVFEKSTIHEDRIYFSFFI
jgi:hypothetical protein